MAVSVNGEPRTTEARTLAELVDETGLAGARIATAVNGEFVPERARAALHLAEGDRIEIVSPRQGG
ncbi:MAG: sulfur carrier protein ThiS [Hyphomicrobiaceae bacterium]|nr:sulfur carrier protein ThiS [Hyphomicrobiaceae bacterium]